MSAFLMTSSGAPVSTHRPVTRPLVAAVAALAGMIGAWTAAVTAPSPQAASPAAVVRHAQPDHLNAILVSTTAATGAAKPGAARPATSLTPRQIASQLLPRFGWSHYQFQFLDPLWTRESGWQVRALNPYSGAYGIPQAVPGSKMAAAGPSWRTSAWTQIRWGLAYIKQRYGSPMAAWKHELATGWY